VIGWLCRRGRPAWLFDTLAVVAGTLVLYIFGVSWLKVVSGMSWTQTLMVGMVPFLPGDIAKMIAAVMMAGSLRRMIRPESVNVTQKA
jgi:biotin transport system substrate-specific component